MLQGNIIPTIEIKGQLIGGGADPAILIEKTITENGIYNAADFNADGFSSVDVNIVNIIEDKEPNIKPIIVINTIIESDLNEVITYDS